MAEEERLLNLFDSYWFERGLFTKKPSSPPRLPSSPPPTAPISQKDQIFEEEPKLPRIQTFHSRSLSDQFMSFHSGFLSDFSSPSSVLQSPKIGEILDQFARSDEAERVPNNKKNMKERERRRNGGSSKSLSELEFQELKGFMDLGFVFSEEDRDSSLVSIIPGLQRLGRRSGQEEEKEETEKEGIEEEEEEAEEVEEEEEEEEVCRPIVSRPYLSEAWGVLDWRKEKNPLMNWTIPSLGNEIDMKDHLRFWAHTVASTVR